MSNRLMLVVLLTVFLVGFAVEVCADDMKNTYAIGKKTAKEWRLESRDYGFGSKLWTINAFLDDAMYDYTKDFWMPIAPWEYMVCSRGLSTQLRDEDEVVATGGGIYQGNESITVAAYRRVAGVNDSFLYEITWYIQPSGEKGYMYTLDMQGNGEELNIQKETGAGQRTGDDGYTAFYSTTNYTSVILRYLDKKLTYPVIEVKDAHRK